MAEAVRTFLRGLGQLLITFGVVVLLFCVYEIKYTNVYTDHEQTTLGRELEHEWAGPAAPAPSPTPTPTLTTTTKGTPAPRPTATAVPAPVSVALGSGFAVLRIPRLGTDWSRVVVEGVGVPDLKRGPGHYPGTALPGDVGNMVLSGHRTTYGAPFSDLDRLRPGDPVVVETRDRWYTYVTTGEQVVAPTAVEVTYPVPGRPGVAPTQRLLTMTTCNPRYSARQRLVVSARLQSAQAKGPGVVPTALAAGG